MEKEDVRTAMNTFLKMYFDACKEVYKEINFDRITRTQFAYLKAIHRHDKTTLTELSEEFGVSKPVITEVIQKFVESNLVTKTKCQEDKRMSYITLTEIGKLLASTNELESKKAVAKIYETLSEEEVKTLVELFNRFGGTTS